MESLLPLSLFAFVSSITPGPNNIMLTSSGIRFGFRRSLPHMLGIVFGFGVMLALCAAGVGSLLLAMPGLHVAMKACGSAYLLYLAWQLRNMSLGQGNDGQARPMSFGGAALFQFVNPKAWVMALTGVSAFLPPVQPVWLAVALFCLVFCAINLPCVSVWAGTGAALRRYLAQPEWQRLFCAVMVVLTLYSAVSIWL
ncbi:MAG TPA: LysE family translocator [Noviherbaspirillum sp.]|uniref:LysE family translocator n=1 Tax=Noviherbaspirillum sp. TaxID=1926288 RepID=UPI002D5E6291|nr:LysE family translocator [Noviherbaspirillum sp.]HYD96037.1 LysE family translocator [Noviherbaspirillum sp.]